MSYILDALKKADAQRQVDSMPGLHGQPVRIVFAHAAARNAWLPAAAVLGAVAVLVLAVWLWPQPPTAVQRAETSPAPAAPTRPAAPQATPPTPLPAPPAEASLPAAPAAPAAWAAPATPAPPARARATERTTTAGPTKAAAPREPPAPATAPTQAGPAVAEAAEGAMPADAPRLQVTGSSYSENPAFRMLFLNGRMFREGEEVAPELRLEQIGQNSARLNFRGQRYRVNF